MNTTAPTPIASTENRPGRPLTIALWVVQIGLALMFLMAGGNKLAGNAMMVGLFDAIGIGQWFRYVTGALEVTGALLLVVPRVTGLGAALLLPVMLGAVSTHLFVLHNSPAMPVGLLVGLAFVAWGRRAQIIAVGRGVARAARS
jgi:putative oxidoreductase